MLIFDHFYRGYVIFNRDFNKDHITIQNTFKEDGSYYCLETSWDISSGKAKLLSPTVFKLKDPILRRRTRKHKRYASKLMRKL